MALKQNEILNFIHSVEGIYNNCNSIHTAVRGLKMIIIELIRENKKLENDLKYQKNQNPTEDTNTNNENNGSV